MVVETLLPLLQRVRRSQLGYLLFVLLRLLVALMVLLDNVANQEHAGGPAYNLKFVAGWVMSHDLPGWHL